MAFCSQVYEGTRLSLLFAGSQVAVTVLIFLLSIKYGYGNFLTCTNKRLYCVAFLGVLTSVVVDSFIYALAVSIGISLMGGSRTVIKSYRHPDTETVTTWVVALIASVFGLLSVGEFDLVLMAYPVYLIVLYAFVIVAIYAGRSVSRKRLSDRASINPGYS